MQDDDRNMAYLKLMMSLDFKIIGQIDLTFILMKSFCGREPNKEQKGN